MNEICELQDDQRLEAIFGCSWPPSAKELAADGKVWKIVDVHDAPDYMAIGSTISFSNMCDAASGQATIKPQIGVTSCSASAGTSHHTTNVWGDVGLKYCAEYNALTGKLDIPDGKDNVHPHTVTIRFSRAKALQSGKPVIICEYDDDVWNHGGTWRAD